MNKTYLELAKLLTQFPAIEGDSRRQHQRDLILGLMRLATTDEKTAMAFITICLDNDKPTTH